MKKIINGKLYDTSTAHLVGEWDNQLYGNPDYAAESLYRKRTGEFFLRHGGGGGDQRHSGAGKKGLWMDHGRHLEKKYGASRTHTRALL